MIDLNAVLRMQCHEPIHDELQNMDAFDDQFGTYYPVLLKVTCLTLMLTIPTGTFIAVYYQNT